MKNLKKMIDCINKNGCSDIGDFDLVKVSKVHLFNCLQACEHYVFHGDGKVESSELNHLFFGKESAPSMMPFRIMSMQNADEKKPLFTHSYLDDAGDGLRIRTWCIVAIDVLDDQVCYYVYADVWVNGLFEEKVTVLSEGADEIVKPLLKRVQTEFTGIENSDLKVKFEYPDATYIHHIDRIFHIPDNNQVDTPAKGKKIDWLDKTADWGEGSYCNEFLRFR